jgi:hypothetical protein
MSARLVVPRWVRLAGPAALLLTPGCGTDYGPADPVASFRFTLEAEGAGEAVLRGDSAAWRNDGPPIHRVFRLVLHAPAAPPGYPAAPLRIEVWGHGSALAGGAIPTPGTWPVVPGTTALGTSVTVEIGDGWRGTAVAGALVIERANADVVTGSLDVGLAVQEDLEPRPPVSLRGRFTAMAWME